jgi:glyoxylase-like metal-dependent hydrolase (beta-lactamase superfamily II)
MKPFELNLPLHRMSVPELPVRPVLGRRPLLAMTTLLIGLVLALFSLTGEASSVRFSLVKTAEARPVDAFGTDASQGDNPAAASHVAVLIEHHAATMLFDTSLGRQIDRQFAEQMPWYNQPLLNDLEVTPVRDQLDRSGVRIDRILLPHAHWDHASGLADFPEVPVWAPYEEIEFSQKGGSPSILSSQFRHGVKWQPYDFMPRPFMGFERSHDLFGDGSLVLVPLKGHTPGSVGLFITLEDGRRFFFPGNLGWHPQGADASAKQRLSRSRLLDYDRAASRSVFERVQTLLKREPALTLVPAHDTRVHMALGYYPSWVQ